MARKLIRHPPQKQHWALLKTTFVIALLFIDNVILSSAMKLFLLLDLLMSLSAFFMAAFCKRDELTCANHDCVPRKSWCDGQIDCADKSDEWNCGKF